MKENDKGYLIKETITYQYPIRSVEYKFYGINKRGLSTKNKKGSYSLETCVPYKSKKNAYNCMVALRHKAHSSAYFTEYEIVDLSDVSI